VIFSRFTEGDQLSLRDEGEGLFPFLRPYPFPDVPQIPFSLGLPSRPGGFRGGGFSCSTQEALRQDVLRSFSQDRFFLNTPFR
jgi:hypothetical protein